MQIAKMLAFLPSDTIQSVTVISDYVMKGCALVSLHQVPLLKLPVITGEDMTQSKLDDTLKEAEEKLLSVLQSSGVYIQPCWLHILRT